MSERHRARSIPELQQIFHTLRTRGDTDYDDISRAVPWIETAAMLDIDISAPQRAQPQGFKSYLSWDDVPKGPAKRYWAHLASWWKHRDDDNVLLLAHELMNQDPEGSIGRVADFCGIVLDDALLAITLENLSFPYMLKHKNKFDDLLMRELSERRSAGGDGRDLALRYRGAVRIQKLSADARIAARSLAGSERITGGRISRLQAALQPGLTLG